MFLSVQQRFILETLKKLGCVRQRQLHILTREKFRRDDLVISETRMDAMLNQLRRGLGDFRLEDDLVKLSAAPPDFQRLEAIDVMLELTGGSPLDFTARLKGPLLLHFTWSTDAAAARTFLVAALPRMGTHESGFMEQYRGSRVIWLSGDSILPEGLSLPPAHFFAARTPDGPHRFYGSNGP